MKGIMKEFESSIFAAELGSAKSVDLHGLNIPAAEKELDAFLDREFMAETEVVKIIHGRGEQKIKQFVEKFLAKHPLVEHWRGSQNPAEQNAVTYAVLGRKR